MIVGPSYGVTGENDESIPGALQGEEGHAWMSSLA